MSGPDSASPAVFPVGSGAIGGVGYGLGVEVNEGVSTGVVEGGCVAIGTGLSNWLGVAVGVFLDSRDLPRLPEAKTSGANVMVGMDVGADGGFAGSSEYSVAK